MIRESVEERDSKFRGARLAIIGRLMRMRDGAEIDL
jgi:hypothetical protein